MKSRALVIFILMMIIYSVNAQSFNEQIYYAYLARDMNLWSKVMQDSEKKLNKPGEKYDFAMAHYGFIGYCL
ncbi:MAG: hypothetical protein NTV01_18815 [Bacteroidia bacterium]|nr:hypothetical protein [Bacteroidia bacterium]